MWGGRCGENQGRVIFFIFLSGFGFGRHLIDKFVNVEEVDFNCYE